MTFKINSSYRLRDKIVTNNISNPKGTLEQYRKAINDILERNGKEPAFHITSTYYG